MKIKKAINNLTNKFLNELFPENVKCYNCNCEISVKDNNWYLCEDCLSKIKPIKYACSVCGEEVNSFTNICNNCKNTKKNFDYACSVTTYSDVAKKIVINLKYYGEKYNAKLIAKFLYKKFLETSKLENVDVAVCVPITKQKLKEKGYNHAGEILKEFCKLSNISFDENCLTRVREVPSQTKLTREERIKNLQGAFMVENQNFIKGKNVLVIDDVITTSSTLNEVALMLKNSGAKSVYGLTFCHTTITQKISKE